MQGHVYYPYEALVKKCQEILQVGREVIVKAFGAIAIDKRIVIENLNEDIKEFAENNKAVYLAKFHLSETSVAGRLRTVVNAPKSIRKIDPCEAME